MNNQEYKYIAPSRGESIRLQSLLASLDIPYSSKKVDNTEQITVNPSKEDTTFGGVDITEMLADDCIKTPDQFTDNQVAAWILYELKENATYYPKGITLENIKRQIDGCFPFGDKRRQTTFMLALNMIDTVNL